MILRSLIFVFLFSSSVFSLGTVSASFEPILSSSKTATLNVLFSMPPLVHTYAPDDSNGTLPPQIRFKFPKGVVVSNPQFPSSNVFYFQNIAYKGYVNSFTVSFRVSALDVLKTPTFSMDVFWALCTDTCVPQKNYLTVSFPKGWVSSQSSVSFWIVLIMAFASGVLLNVMPCVFPVLSLKIFDFLKLSQTEDKPLWQFGLVFSFGVLLSLWGLFVLLLCLKLLGFELGWGFQLQSPVFVFLMAVFFLVLALQFLGVFEWGASLTALGQWSYGKKGFFYSFLTGVLATVVATPCSAPFMGTALGYALLHSFYEGFCVFTALGFGISFPYLMLTFFPALLSFLPKPGKWMVILRRVLSIPLFVTVLWLSYVFYLQVFSSPPVSVSSSSLKNKDGFVVYSSSVLKQFETQKKPVFIKFTAAWCLSCQVNEKRAFSSGRVIRALHEDGIVPVVADWTTYDPEVTSFLARFGRNSIPFYVFITADGRVIPLPEWINEDTVIEVISNLR